MKLSPEEVLLKAIRANTELVTYVGDRIFPEVAPAGTQDGWIAYQRISSADDATSHDGYEDLSEPVYQVTFWTADARKRRLVREVLLNTFRLKRVMVDTTEAVLATQDDRDLSDEGPPRMYGASIDISVSL